MKPIKKNYAILKNLIIKVIFLVPQIINIDYNYLKTLSKTISKVYINKKTLNYK